MELGRERPAGLGNFSYPLYERVRDDNHAFRQLLAMSSPVVRAADDTDTPPVGRYVSGNFFEALGALAPRSAGCSTPDDDRIDEQGSLVAVIGYGLWQRLFGRDPGVLGKTLTVSSGPFDAAPRGYTIVGVLPRTFQGLTVGRSDDFFLPITTNARLGQPKPAGLAWCGLVEGRRPFAARTFARHRSRRRGRPLRALRRRPCGDGRARRSCASAARNVLRSSPPVRDCRDPGGNLDGR